MVRNRPAPSSRGSRIGVLGALVALLTVLLGPLAATPAAADPHSGRATVKVRSLVVEPHGDAWHARVTLINNNTGDKVRGSKVTAAVGSAKPVTLTSGSVAGEFAGMLPDVKPGPVDLTLKVRGVPGADALLPYDNTWKNVQLTAGEPVAVVGGSDGGGSKMPLILGIVGGVIAVALLLGLYRARRRTAVPAPTR